MHTTFPNRLTIHIACVFTLLLFAGCSLTPVTIDLAYAPRGARERVAGAEQVKVEVLMTDQRAIRDSVGKKMNSFGGDGAAITAKNDVVELVKSSIESELTRRGFARGSNAVVAVQLVRFYNEFANGFWAGDSTAEIILNAQVKDQAGTVIFSKRIAATGVEANIQVANGNNAKIA